jgi:hypothetical protein
MEQWNGLIPCDDERKGRSSGAGTMLANLVLSVLDCAER